MGKKKKTGISKIFINQNYLNLSVIFQMQHFYLAFIYGIIVTEIEVI
jgi:hypothetical protein